MLLPRALSLCTQVLRSHFTLSRPQGSLICKFHYHILAKPKLTSKSNHRHFSIWFKKPSEAELKLSDKIAPEYKLVYNTTIDKYLVAGQIVTIVCGGILGLLVIYSGDPNFTVLDKKLQEPQSENTELLIYLTALFLCIFAVQRLTVKVPIRIYKSAKTKQYVFVSRGFTPFSKKYFTCGANQLRKVEDTSLIVPWKDCTYELVQGNDVRTLILMDYYFKRPAELNILLGYQKEDED